jgi:hypothetical protein
MELFFYSTLLVQNPCAALGKEESPLMPRIPEPEIERLKGEVSVERLVASSGIELKKSGKDWLARCPFHEDDTASLVVTPAKNLWHCFGCGIGGGRRLTG